MVDPTSTALLLLCVAVLAVCACVIAVLVGGRRGKIWNFGLNRYHGNPVLSPREHHEWEAAGSFNPAAVDDNGLVHLFYRALGRDGVSRIGHAASGDGRNFSERSPYPVHQPRIGCGLPETPPSEEKRRYDLAAHPSGGGWAGAEDPRAVIIEDRLFVTYTAFESWENARIAVTSMAVNDLRKRRWNWKEPVFLSPQGEVNKNWVLFPEKIGGKYAILHGVAPNVSVEYLDSLDRVEPLKSRPPKGGRPDHWDNWVRGAGPPPLKTSLGWLLLYHAMDRADPNRYKVGAMILASDRPEKVLYRSPRPILEPDLHYENDGKPGVVYATGAVIRDDSLLVYYGGGDRHSCVAETPLSPLLEWLSAYGRVGS